MDLNKWFISCKILLDLTIISNTKTSLINNYINKPEGKTQNSEKNDNKEDRFENKFNLKKDSKHFICQAKLTICQKFILDFISCY